jgi:hypothetical protein
MNLSVHLIPEEADRFARAADEVGILVSEAENVLALLALILREGDHDGHLGIADMAALAGKALAAFGERQSEDLVILSTRLKEAKAARIAA